MSKKVEDLNLSGSQVIKPNYVYNAYVTDAYDGDTIRVILDLGFGIKRTEIDNKGIPLRLLHIDAWELRGEEKLEGRSARDFLRSKILHKDIIIKSEKVKDISKGKYGRYLVEVYYWVNEEKTIQRCLNAELVLEGHAEYKKY